METEKKNPFLEICKWSGLALLFMGALLRIYIYLNCKDLWADELSLASSIWSGDVLSILKGRLQFSQSSPLGFMLLTKLVTVFAGTSEYALRFLPFVSGLASGFLLWVVARREVDELYALICALLFVACLPLLKYVSEFKQYGTEAFVTILFLYMYSKSLDSLSKNKIPLSLVLVLCAGLLFTLPGFFVFCGLASSALIMAFRRGEFSYFLRNNKYKIIFMLVFVGLHLIYVWQTRKPHMFVYFEKNFLPLNPAEFREHAKTTLAPIFNLSMQVTDSNYGNFLILAFCFFGGLLFLYRERFHLFWPVFMTGLFFVSASALKLYPFGHAGLIGSRLSLFYFPLIFAAVSYFLYVLYNTVRTEKIFAAMSWLAFLLIVKSVLVTQYEFIKYGGDYLQQTSGLIGTINEKFDEASEIIVNGDAVRAYKYYQHLNNKDFAYSAIEIGKDPVSDLRHIVGAGAEKGRNTYYFLFANYDNETYAAYERCVEFIERTYHLKEIVEAPGARLVIFGN